MAIANKRFSMYARVQNFLGKSEIAPQWTGGVGVGAAAGAAYGLGNGILSDNTTAFGGTVGGGTFGAIAGAGIAYAAHKSTGFRNLASDLAASASGAKKAVSDAMSGFDAGSGMNGGHKHMDKAFASAFAGAEAGDAKAFEGLFRKDFQAINSANSWSPSPKGNFDRSAEFESFLKRNGVV